MDDVAAAGASDSSSKNGDADGAEAEDEDDEAAERGAAAEGISKRPTQRLAKPCNQVC